MNGKVVIVDDEIEIAELMEVYLTNEDFDVYKYTNATDMLREIDEINPDVAILDVMLPDMDGFILCRELRKNWVFPIIMLTAVSSEADIIKGMTMGADDYVVKPFNPLEVTARVKAALRRVRDYDLVGGDNKHILLIRGLKIDIKKHKLWLYDEEIELTPLEFDIMKYLMEHVGDVVSSEELFEQVWKEKFLDNNNTVMAHIARIRDKLHENSRKPEYIKTVWGVGYKIDE